MVLFIPVEDTRKFDTDTEHAMADLFSESDYLGICLQTWQFIQIFYTLHRCKAKRALKQALNRITMYICAVLKVLFILNWKKKSFENGKKGLSRLADAQADRRFYHSQKFHKSLAIARSAHI